MRAHKINLTLAVEEHILSGKPITTLEAIVLFGVPDISKSVQKLHKTGWRIELKKIPYARAVVRLNEHAVLTPPPSLPTREILLTEYQLKT